MIVVKIIPTQSDFSIGADFTIGPADTVTRSVTADSRRHDPPFSETGSCKLEVGS